MSEETESTQPIKATQPVKARKRAATPPPAPQVDPEPASAPEEEAETQPKKKFNLLGFFRARKPASPSQEAPETGAGPEEKSTPKPKKKLKLGSLLVNLLVFLAIIGLGIFGGYQSGISIRKQAKTTLVSQQLSDQFSRALVDIQFGHYNTAQQRLEYIISVNPTFPGAMEKLTEVMVLTNMPTPTPVATPTPQLILENTNYDAMLAQAQQLVAAGQWQNALVVLDTLRKEDATFNPVQVDGMYYFSLRNLGVDMIKAGNLEGGIYQLTLAERFAPLDNTAHVLRDNARFYITAASFWELNWGLCADYFSQLSGSGIWDGTMTATERYYFAAMRFGDELYAQEAYCEAYDQYMAAKAIGELDETAAKNANRSYQACYPPTEEIPTVIVETFEEPVVTEDPPATEEQQ